MRLWFEVPKSCCETALTVFDRPESDSSTAGSEMLSKTRYSSSIPSSRARDEDLPGLSFAVAISLNHKGAGDLELVSGHRRVTSFLLSLRSSLNAKA